MGGSEASYDIALMEIVCIVLFEAISKLQRKDYSMRVAVFREWTNIWMIPASEELNAVIAPVLLPTQSVVGGRHLHMREIGCPTKLSVMEMPISDMIQFSKNSYKLTCMCT